MSAAALIVGPGAVTGPNPVSDEMVCAAIDAIDDTHVLIDDRPIEVDELWTRIMADCRGDTPCPPVLVCPGWWSEARLDRIARAAGGPRILRRHEVLARDRRCGVIEIAPEFVLCHLRGAPLTVTPRLGSTAEVARTVAQGIVGAVPLLIDAPVGVAGAAELAAALAGRLRGHEVEIVDDATLAVILANEQRPPVTTGPRRRRAVWAVSAGLLLATLALLAAPRPDVPTEHPTTLLTEGRVTVQIPAHWVVRRVTGGTGSPRLEVVSPDDEAAAILLTQSVGRPDPAGTAEALQAALDVQPPGVFSGLRTDDHRGGRPVLSYTERRADREIAWAVFLDGHVRIALGCRQRASGAVIRPYCDAAIRSAHAAR